jgi:crotonobetainyl-CoA:carnitine CoA-transferase CaiB-like acyl-CoA transferase
VEVSLFEALAEWMGAPAYYTEYGGRAPERTGGETASSDAPSCDAVACAARSE